MINKFVSVLLIVVMIFSFLPQALAVEEVSLPSGQQATVLKVRGTTEVKVPPDEKWTTIRTSKVVPAGGVIKTSKDSGAKIKLSDGSSMRIYENTTITITKIDQTPEKKVALFKLLLGKIRANVPKLTGKDSRFEIETPTAVASVRGTDFEVEVYEEKGKPQKAAVVPAIVGGAVVAEGEKKKEGAVAPVVTEEGKKEGAVAPVVVTRVKTNKGKVLVAGILAGGVIGAFTALGPGEAALIGANGIVQKIIPPGGTQGLGKKIATGGVKGGALLIPVGLGVGLAVAAVILGATGGGGGGATPTPVPTSTPTEYTPTPTPAGTPTGFPTISPGSYVSLGKAAIIPGYEEGFNPDSPSGVQSYWKPGDTLTYVLWYRNNQEGVTLRNVTIEDTVPPNLIYVEGSASPEPITHSTPVVAGNKITWNVGDFEFSFDYWKVWYSVQVNPDLQLGPGERLPIENFFTMNGTNPGVVQILPKDSNPVIIYIYSPNP